VEVLAAMTERVMLLSMLPPWPHRILCGPKRLDLRTQRPRVSFPMSVLLYETGRRGRGVLGLAMIEGIIRAAPAWIWAILGQQTGVEEGDFQEAYFGRAELVGLCLGDPLMFPNPVSLAELRQIFGADFRPGRSWRYLDRRQAERIAIAGGLATP